MVRKTLNPTFDETFTFYGVDGNQLSSGSDTQAGAGQRQHQLSSGLALHFAVLSFDRFSRDDLVGGHDAAGALACARRRDDVTRRPRRRAGLRAELGRATERRWQWCGQVGGSGLCLPPDSTQTRQGSENRQKHIKIKLKIVYSVWQQCMLDSHNYIKIQIQIRQ